MPIVNATNVGDTYITSFSPDENNSSLTTFSVGSFFSTDRGLLKFTLPNYPGTITDLKLKIYGQLNNVDSGNLNLYSCSRTDVEITEATWNIYKTGSSWTTPGGDITGSVIDSVTITATSAWHTLYLIGPEATNPITPVWGNTYVFILKDVGYPYANLNSKENASNNPYLEITYGSTITGVNSISKISSITL